MSHGKQAKATTIHFTLTSKILLRQAMQQDGGQLCSFVDADSTYNLLSNGYPLLILGTVDANNKFRLIGSTVSMHEDEHAFTTALQAVKNGLFLFCEYNWCPSYAMADSAGAIHNALLAVFPGIKVAKCYFHMRQAIVHNKARFRTEANYEQFMEDTKMLAGLPNEEQFLQGLSMLERKWVRRELDMMSNWFMPYWGTEIKRNWFVGFTAPGLPNRRKIVRSA